MTLYRIDEERLRDLYGSYAIQGLINEFRFRGVLVPDTRLEAIADTWASLDLEEVEWDTWYDNATAFNDIIALLNALTKEES